MARIEITVPGERIVEEFTALVQQPVTPTGAPALKVGLVEISQTQPTELIPGPMGPQGPRGSRWFTGAGDPTVPGGVTGDMYLDDVSGAVWQWDGTAWVNTGTNIQGSPDTGPQILAKLAPVDGAGSGLDADLLDGQHGAYYLDWPNQTNKPATFPPTLPIPWSGISGQPATYPPTLPIPSSGVTGLDAKQASQDAAINAKVGPDAPSDGLTYGRKNATWATIVGGAVISDTAPPGPLTPGQLWWESDTGNTFLWFDDGDTQQWVQQNIQPAPSYLGDYVLKTGDTMTGVLTATALTSTVGPINSATHVNAAIHVSAVGSIIAGGGGDAVLGTTSGTTTGGVYLRPRGYNSVTNQTSIDATGNMIVSGVITGFSLNAGTYSTTGATAGVTTTGSVGRTNSSVTTSASAIHYSFYSPSGAGTYVGYINTNGTVTAFGTSSDENLKTLNAEYDPAEAIAIIRADPVLDFTWKTTGEKAIGWFAQKSHAIDANLAISPPEPEEGKERVAFGEEGYEPWGIDYGRRTPYLWAALTAALDKIDQLEARLAALEGGV